MVGVWRGLLWRGPGWKGLRGDRSHWAKGEGGALDIEDRKNEFIQRQVQYYFIRHFKMIMNCQTHLCAAVSLPVFILAAAHQILHQDGREDANDAVELALPEAVVLVGLSAQDADDGSFRKGQLVVRLSRVVVQSLCKRHCNTQGWFRNQNLDTPDAQSWGCRRSSPLESPFTEVAGSSVSGSVELLEE